MNILIYKKERTEQQNRKTKRNKLCTMYQVDFGQMIFPIKEGYYVDILLGGSWVTIGGLSLRRGKGQFSQSWRGRWFTW